MIWPALLLALQRQPGYEWMELPRRVYAHSFWVSDGQKMSKSLGNFVDLERLERCREPVGLDGLRYFLATDGPLDVADRDFTEARFAEVYNAELANLFGNLVQRAASLVARYADGVVPAPGPPDGRRRAPARRGRRACPSGSRPPSTGWRLDRAAEAILALRDVGEPVRRGDGALAAREGGRPRAGRARRSTTWWRRPGWRPGTSGRSSPSRPARPTGACPVATRARASARSGRCRRARGSRGVAALSAPPGAALTSALIASGAPSPARRARTSGRGRRPRLGERQAALPRAEGVRGRGTRGG